uniref:Uncharacterized protein n=1 Tax=Anguilla anguilla TaxID=7936 RepID=A0A0E9TDJ4_ANGAN
MCGCEIYVNTTVCCVTCLSVESSFFFLFWTYVPF